MKYIRDNFGYTVYNDNNSYETEETYGGEINQALFDENEAQYIGVPLHQA